MTTAHASRFGHLEVMAVDVEACVRFYADGLGFAIDQRQGVDVVWLRAGPVALVVRRGTEGPRRETYLGSGAGIVVYVDDLRAALTRLARAGFEPVGHDGSPVCPLVRDPAGNWIQIVDLKDQT